MLPQSSADQYKRQQQIALLTVTAAGKLWQGMDDDFTASWTRVGADITAVAQTGRLAAATVAASYLPAVLAETNQDGTAYGEIVPAAFISAAPDGRSMSTLLDESVIKARVAVAGGRTSSEALLEAGRWLTGTLLTVMADTGRAVNAADIAQRPSITGYTRMLNPPSCSRCAILAGKWFRWNEGFLRHPRCDCRHIPSSEDTAGDLRTDPYEYFNSLSKDDQAKIFGRIDARAIEAGGDIYRVVNIGHKTKAGWSGRGLATAKGHLRYGTPSRMTVDDIFRTAGTRTNAIRMMEEEGYITGPQIRGGNILGNGPAAQGFGQLGKGGKAKAATDAVLQANATGVRDPLNRYTMTAAERRLYDAKTRLDIGRTGIWPQSVGANSADKYSPTRPITAGQLSTLQRELANQRKKLAAEMNKPGGAPSLERLARALGLI